MTRASFSRRCIPNAFVVSIVCALFVCAGAAAATATEVGRSAVLYASNGVSASVRAVQPAVSGLFQLHAPRVWADAASEAGEPVANGVPDFLDTWEAFGARTSSAILKSGYVFTTVDALGHYVLYAGVQRGVERRPRQRRRRVQPEAGATPARRPPDFRGHRRRRKRWKRPIRGFRRRGEGRRVPADCGSPDRGMQRRRDRLCRLQWISSRIRLQPDHPRQARDGLLRH